MHKDTYQLRTVREGLEVRPAANGTNSGKSNPNRYTDRYTDTQPYRRDPTKVTKAAPGGSIGILNRETFIRFPARLFPQHVTFSPLQLYIHPHQLFEDRTGINKVKMVRPKYLSFFFFLQRLLSRISQISPACVRYSLLEGCLVIGVVFNSSHFVADTSAICSRT